MANVTICDATSKPIPEGEEEVVGWGLRRVYSKEGLEAYEEYAEGLKEASLEARKVYLALRAEATNKFKTDYPDGKLPDTEDEDEQEDD